MIRAPPVADVLPRATRTVPFAVGLIGVLTSFLPSLLLLIANIVLCARLTSKCTAGKQGQSCQGKERACGHRGGSRMEAGPVGMDPASNKPIVVCTWWSMRC